MRLGLLDQALEHDISISHLHQLNYLILRIILVICDFITT